MRSWERKCKGATEPSDLSSAMKTILSARRKAKRFVETDNTSTKTNLLSILHRNTSNTKEPGTERTQKVLQQ